MYFFLGISLLFALLLALNFLVSAAATILWCVIEKPTQNWSAQMRAQVIFSFRIFPLLAAIILVFAFLLPSYIIFEPHSSDEIVSAKLAILAAISLIGIAAAFYRIFGTWWRTRRLVKSWMRRSEPIFIENLRVPVYRITHPFPVIAVVGTFRPKMFVAEQIFDSLDEKEFGAAIAHECGHLAAKDNFKRTLLRICRDLLVFPLGKTLDNAWAENAESAADEYAAQTGDTTALNLAAALVKIAKIVPQNSSPVMPLGAFLIENQSADVTRRVRRLIQLADNSNLSEPQSTNNLKIVFQTCFALVFAAIFFLATNYYFLSQVHTALEKFVAIVQ
jgi:Zn-dependent protease with chaperone function